MKLLLALSVVLIALSMLAEPASAESEEPTLKDRVKNFGETLKDAFVKVGDKIKGIPESEFAKNTRNFFTESFRNIKEKFSK